MRRIIRTFGEFERIFESNSGPNAIEIRYPEKWKKLQDLGFYDATTPLMAKNGSILLKNDKFNYYPAGISLQPSGYVRDKGVTTGFLKKNQSWEMMADYLINRFQKYETETSGGFSPDQVVILQKISKGKKEIDPNTGRVNILGECEVHRSFFNELKEQGLKLGRIKGDFYLSLYTGKDEPLFEFTEEDFEFLPLEVGGNFSMSRIKFPDQPDFSKFPKVKKSISLNFIEGIKTLQGINLEKGQAFTVSELPDLESLGNSFPSTVGEFQIGTGWGSSVDFSKLKTMEGCPKEVKGNFIFRGTMIEDLRGCPQKIGSENGVSKDLDIRVNPQLKSLAGLPINFDGYIKTDYFECPFSIEDRIKMLGTDKISSSRTGERYWMDPTARKLVASSIPPDFLQQEIDENPSKMIFALKGLLDQIKKIPGYQNIHFPEKYKGEVGLVNDLGDIGL